MSVFSNLYKKIPTAIHKHPKYLFLFPWFGLVFWYAMLISMLAYWGGEGRPIWHWLYGYHISPQNYKKNYGSVGLIYISDIGTTKMQGVFIAFSLCQGIVYFLTVYVWYVINYTNKNEYIPSQKMPVTEESDSSSEEVIEEAKPEEVAHRKKFFKFTEHEKNLIYAALFFAFLGSAGIFFCSVFNTRDFHHAHFSMVGLFLAGLAISVILTGTSFILTGKDVYIKEHNVLEHSIGYKFWTKEYYTKMLANVWLISGVIKLVWVIIAIVFAICFGAIDKNDISAVFEWLVAFWYGIIFIIWSVDMYIHRKLSYVNTA
ncbi:Sfk1 protein [Hanseniaspora uvarum]|nr:Sfk1 protein [Hanseniaspora uvarum]